MAAAKQSKCFLAVFFSQKRPFCDNLKVKSLIANRDEVKLHDSQYKNSKINVY
jgi:hypothetical protein